MPMDYHETKDFKGGWRSAIFIIFMEMAERFAYYGIAANLIMYLTTVMEQPLVTAAKNVNTWQAASSLALFIAAFFADSYLGRFKTTLVSSSIYLLGLTLITISTSSQIPHDIMMPLFYAGLYITAIGEGGHKPCVQTFAADQFDEDTPEQKKTKSSFFNWWFLGIAIGGMTAVVIVTYVEDNISWTIGFSIPTASAGLALLVFLIGSRTYRKERPVGSPFTRVAQVFVVAYKKRDFNNVDTSERLCYDDDGLSGLEMHKLAHTNQLRFLDKAMIIDEQDVMNKRKDPWRLCSQNQVEEVKLILRLIPIWICTFAYAIVVAQVHTFFIKQASTMNRSIGSKFKIPPASLQVLQGITVLITVPIYDKFFVPIMRKLTKCPTGINTLQRIGIGLALSVLTIMVAALVEKKRVNIASRNGLTDLPKETVPMSVSWLFPQFIIMGLSGFFTYVGIQEIFYDQMPEDMRSMGSAFTNGAIGIGAMMSTAVISLVQEISSRTGEKWLIDNLNRAHLDHFYWVVSGFCSLNLVVYVLVSKRFVWKRSQVDQ
ncbi:protein NRT1/ PTR FAMILY 5.4-like [Silene latifolia]|uniref:protein NRT1/ PTR FAMILY 5.4-like n=1 Tax=Silene latifolia TaxID=37657 RepID=UPI003D77B5F7